MPGEEYGRPDRGIPAGTDETTEINDDTFVVCARSRGLSMMLVDAQREYDKEKCNPDPSSGTAKCPHQKSCLKSHLHWGYGSENEHPVAVGEELTLPRASRSAVPLVDQAFHGLPRGNRKFRTVC